MEREEIFTYYVIDNDFIALCCDCFIAAIEDGLFNEDSFTVEYSDHFICDVCD